MMLLLLSMQAQADQLVVLQSEEQRVLANTYYSNADVIFTWKDLQKYPLKFSNVESTGDCSVYPKTLSDVNASLANVKSALNYMELDQADGHLLRVEGDLRCLNETVSSELLSKVYFISGLTHYYRQDEAGAVSQWKQAYALNQELVWDETYEPSGKGLFEETLTGTKFSAKSTLITLPSTLQVSLDGQISSNASTVHSGKHLLQYGEELHSHLIDVEEASDFYVIGFDAFDSELNLVMQEKQSRTELLKALQLGTPYSEYVIVTADDSWTLIPGSKDWSTTRVEDLAQSQMELGNSNKRRPYLSFTAIGTASLSALSFYLAGQTYDKYMTSVDGLEALEQQNQTYILSGVGLGIVSGGLLVAGVTKW